MYLILKFDFQYIITKKTKFCNEGENTKRGRPTRGNQNKIKKILKQHYEKGISATATSKETNLNIKTVSKYFTEWDKKLLEYNELDFLKRAKITKEKIIQSFEKDIISLDKDEKEIEMIKNIAKQNGSISHFEKLSKLKLKIKEQKLKILSAKINLINTPTADTVINLEKEDD